MKALLTLTLAAALSGCALLPAPVAPDPQGATFTRVSGPNYDTLTYLPGKTATSGTVAHLVGPRLRVNDLRCAPEPSGLAYAFGTVPAPERRVIYVSGLSSGTLDAARPDGSTVHIALK